LQVKSTRIAKIVPIVYKNCKVKALRLQKRGDSIPGR